MKKSLMRNLFALTMALMLVLGMAACQKPQESKQQSNQESGDQVQAGYPVKWTENFDGKETEFELKEAPKKAISMSQATTEMMLALGLADQMAGTAFLEEDIYDSVKADYEKVKVLSEKWPSYEVFMAENPDFASGWAVPFTKRGIEAKDLVKENVSIFIPESMKKDDADLDTFFADMLFYGKIFGQEEKAQKFVQDQQAKLEVVLEKLKDLPEKTVFIYDSEDDQPFTVYEGYTSNVLKLIGAKNILSGKGVNKTWEKASWEEIVAGDPDYILIVDYGTSIRNNDDFDAKVEKIKSNPLTQDMQAVKNGHFLKVKLSEITPGIRTVDALERLADQLHSDK